MLARMRGRAWTRAAAVAVVAVLGALAPQVAPAALGPRPGADPAVPNLETFELASPLIDPASPGGALERRRQVPKVQVLLPDGYDDHPSREYPVLWLLHGANGGTDTWIPGILELLPDFPGIIVMPDGGLFGMYVDWWNGGARAGPSWATYHLEVLRQEIHARYRIKPGRRWHAIAGISMGGQGALRYASMLPGYFGSVAAFSAALPDMQSLQAQHGISLVSLAQGRTDRTYEPIFGPPGGAYAEGNSPQQLVVNLAHTRLYITSGNGIPCLEDPIPDTLALDIVTEGALNDQRGPYAAAVRDAGGDVTSVDACGVHTFGVWDRAIPLAREWGFFRDVEDRPDRWAYRTIATAGEMWGFRFRFTAPPATVAQFVRTGTVLSGTGTGEVVITGPPGCELRVTLPFVQDLDPVCA